MMRRFSCGAALAAALLACGSSSVETPAPVGPGATVQSSAQPPHSRLPLDQVTRDDFNQLAVELYLPLFWDSDADKDGTLDADELAVTFMGFEAATREDWVLAGAFTDRFFGAYGAIVGRKTSGPTLEGLAEPEVKRLKLLQRELAQGRPVLLRTSFTGASAQDRAIVANIRDAARVIERIYLRQMGSDKLRSAIPAHDPMGFAVFFRNQGPWCVAPETEKDPLCNAIPSAPKTLSGIWPESLQADPGFCDKLKDQPNAEQLRHQFTAVREQDGKLVAVPYREAWQPETLVISNKLRAAAAAIATTDEAAFKSYLEAAAQAFLDDSWEAADEAWAKMNVHNSKWYLRIAPDEVYWDPCSLKAGYHVSFARINQDSLRWQSKLEPVKNDLEQALAALAGAPYQARQVSFHLPDFIDIVLNAGDSRDPHGATIGQSLPNWGPVANEGRGRTVAMTNLYTDADSRVQLEKQASSLLCKDTMAGYTTEPEPQVLGTVLHEAAHNLGPAHEYQVNGKKDREVFGGPLASMLEELKAQTAALYFTDWLLQKKLIDGKLAREAHLRDVTWAFGHISRGLYTSDGKPRPYSQLAAIQVLWLAKNGAVEWRAAEKAANGSDVGCFAVKTEAFPPVVEKLMREVAGIKGRGDKDRALGLLRDYADVSGEQKKLLDVITERWLRAPKASFVYAVEL